MKSILEYLINKDYKYEKDLIYTYRKGDDIDEIINDFDKKYNLFVSFHGRPFTVSAITFNISPKEYNTTWKNFTIRHAYNHHAGYPDDDIVTYLIASNINIDDQTNGAQNIAMALNKSKIGYNDWFAEEPENERNVIKLTSKHSEYSLTVWKK